MARGKSQELQLSLPAGGDVVQGNRNALMQAVNNLLSNAIKYKKTNVPLEMSILAEKVGDEIHLSFKDNGIGIDLTTFGEELFKPYTQENKSTDRGGLGLSILAQHLEQHGDEIRVESQRGEGTTFTFVFKTDSVV
jgi:signal transduction histidine kinase